MKIGVKIILIGLGATFATDCWALFLKLFGVNSNGLLIIGTWIVNNVLNVDASLTQSWIIGWTTHYFLGIILAFLFVFFYKKKWLQSPKISNAILFGVITLIIPLCIVWPILGFGFAFSKTSIQSTLILKAVILHLIYGIGLFLSVKIINKFQSHISKKTNE